MREAWRFWLTGGVAAVLAAASERPAERRAARAWRSSRYSLKETTDRLEHQARQLGLSVFARLAAPSRGVRRRVPDDTLLLVLGIDGAHTLVLQSTADAGLELPLTVRIERQDDGDTRVEFADSSWVADCGELPADLVHQVAALPRLVDAALS